MCIPNGQSLISSATIWMTSLSAVKSAGDSQRPGHREGNPHISFPCRTGNRPSGHSSRCRPKYGLCAGNVTFFVPLIFVKARRKTAFPHMILKPLSLGSETQHSGGMIQGDVENQARQRVQENRQTIIISYSRNWNKCFVNRLGHDDPFQRIPVDAAQTEVLRRICPHIPAEQHWHRQSTLRLRTEGSRSVAMRASLTGFNNRPSHLSINGKAISLLATGGRRKKGQKQTPSRICLERKAVRVCAAG
jgi:hypothetical protein